MSLAYLVSETMRLVSKYGPKISDADKKVFANYKTFLGRYTKFIPS